MYEMDSCNGKPEMRVLFGESFPNDSLRSLSSKNKYISYDRK